MVINIFFVIKMTEKINSRLIAKVFDDIKRITKIGFKYMSPSERKELNDETNIEEKIDGPLTTAIVAVAAPVTKRLTQKDFLATYKEKAKTLFPNLKAADREDMLKTIYKVYKEHPEYTEDQLFGKPAPATVRTAAPAPAAATVTSTELVVVPTEASTATALVASPKRGPGRPPTQKHRFTVPQRNAIWNHWIGDAREHKCLSCYGANPSGRLITKEAFECGHIKAETNGGSHAVTNVIPICSACNKSCGSKNMIHYVTTTFGKKLIERLRGIHPDWNPEE